MSEKKAILQLPGVAEPIELPIYSGTLGQDVIDINQLGKYNVFTFDPGFVATASCESKITFIDGSGGILLHRGYPIEQLAKESNYLEHLSFFVSGLRG